MELELTLYCEGSEVADIAVEIDNFDLIDTTEYRQALFDATMQGVKDELIRAGVL